MSVITVTTLSETNFSFILFHLVPTFVSLFCSNTKRINIFGLVVLINKRKEQNDPSFFFNVNNDEMM